MLTILTASARDRIYLKNGSVIDAAIASVYSRHLVDSAGTGIMLRQIDSLFTTERRIAAMFTTLDSSISVQNSEEGYRISLTQYTPPPYYTVPSQVLTPQSISLLYRYDLYGRMGFYYDGIILEHWNLVHRFQGSIAIDRKQAIFSSLNFAFGLGGRWEFDRFTYSAVMNGGIYGGIPDYDRDSWIHRVAFVSLTVGYHITGPVQSFIGADCFLYRESTIVPERAVLPYCGIAVKL
jgi:hypothetical protein